MAASQHSLSSSSAEKQGVKDEVLIAQINIVEADDAYLEQLGYKSEFKRDFTFLGLFSLVQSELAVLPGVAGTIWSVAVVSGCSRPPRRIEVLI